MSNTPSHKPGRQSIHDPGGTVGGLKYWDPLFRPGKEYWRPANEAARLLVRMNVAFWMGAAAIVIRRRTADLAEQFVARCQAITSLYALHRAMFFFHKMFVKNVTEPRMLSEEAALFDQLQTVAPHNGPMKTMRDRIAAHVDHLLEAQDDDLAQVCADIQSFNTKMEPILLATERYLRFAWTAHQDEWMTQGHKGQSIQILQKTLGPLVVGEDDPEKVPGGPGSAEPSSFSNDLHEAHSSDKTREQTGAEVRAALERERARLTRMIAEGRSSGMIPPDTPPEMLAQITKYEEAVVKKRMDECERKAREYRG